MIDTEALRSKVLSLALQGKLTMRFPEDGNAQNLYDEIQQHKKELIKSGIVKKKKELVEITEGEIPFEIPENWVWVRIGVNAP